MNRIQELPLFSLATAVNNTMITAGCFDTEHVTTATVYEQAKNTFAKLDKVITEGGFSKQDVLSASVWLPLRGLTEQNHPTIAAEDAAEFNKAWVEYFGDIKPARDTVGVGFVFPTFLCEIKFILAK